MEHSKHNQIFEDLVTDWSNWQTLQGQFYKEALQYISLIKQQLVITHTICQTEIPALLDSWVTNTLSVKMLYLQTSSPYVFLKKKKSKTLNLAN